MSDGQRCLLTDVGPLYFASLHTKVKKAESGETPSNGETALVVNQVVVKTDILEVREVSNDRGHSLVANVVAALR